MTRSIAIKRGKELKALKNKTETELLNKIGLLLSKSNLSSEEELEVKEIQLKTDQIYIEIAKGAFVRCTSGWKRGKRTPVIVLLWRKEMVKESH